jgi:hypothetical protein
MNDLASERRHAPAAERNAEPILQVLKRVLPARGHTLELASGTGQHICHFAAAFPDRTWQPSDPDPAMRASIEGWRHHLDLSNVEAPVDLDVHSLPWPIASVDAILNINMIHISPWSACQALVRGASAALPKDGVLFLYGPYRIGGEHTSSSNARFDESLRTRDPSWGVRDLDEVVALAAHHGLRFVERVAMPANNFSVIFRREAPGGG